MIKHCIDCKHIVRKEQSSNRCSNVLVNKEYKKFLANKKFKKCASARVASSKEVIQCGIQGRFWAKKPQSENPKAAKKTIPLEGWHTH